MARSLNQHASATCKRYSKFKLEDEILNFKFMFIYFSTLLKQNVYTVIRHDIKTCNRNYNYFQQT